MFGRIETPRGNERSETAHSPTRFMACRFGVVALGG
jgi:hypothetical protein